MNNVHDKPTERIAHEATDLFMRQSTTFPGARGNAALSRAVVIPECGIRSGSRNTARWARNLGRPVFAVPGPVHSAASAGCHDLIATGEALLATDPEQTLRTAVGEPPSQFAP